MSETPVNGDLKVVLLHISYITKGIDEMKEQYKGLFEHIETVTAQTADQETRIRLVTQRVEDMRPEVKKAAGFVATIVSAIVAGIAAFVYYLLGR